LFFDCLVYFYFLILFDRAVSDYSCDYLELFSIQDLTDVFAKFDALGEKTLNKIAEMALASQIEQADTLSVKVKTNPDRLAKGMLESLAIAGTGLVMNESLRMQAMQIDLDAIAVSPFKALMGNIQLTQPSQGKACFTLSEADIVSAMNPIALQQQLAHYRMSLDGQRVTVEVQGVDCQLQADGKMQIQATFNLPTVNELRTVSLTLTPRVCATQQGIILGEYELGADSDRELSVVAIDALLAQALRVLNLQDFQMEGFSLKINELEIDRGQLKLKADAGLTSFPSNN
jgi:hypothetical protein